MLSPPAAVASQSTPFGLRASYTSISFRWAIISLLNVPSAAQLSTVRQSPSFPRLFVLVYHILLSSTQFIARSQMFSTPTSSLLPLCLCFVCIAAITHLTRRASTKSLRNCMMWQPDNLLRGGCSPQPASRGAAWLLPSSSRMYYYYVQTLLPVMYTSWHILSTMVNKSVPPTGIDRHDEPDRHRG